jgi:hypothetical protein
VEVGKIGDADPGIVHDEGGVEADATLVHQRYGRLGLLQRDLLVQDRKDVVLREFQCGSHDPHPAFPEFLEQALVLQDVVDARRDVVCQLREVAVQATEHIDPVTLRVEPVGVEKGEMVHPHVHQLADVLMDDLLRDEADLAVVGGEHRAVEAPVMTPARRLCGANDDFPAKQLVQLEIRVLP